VIRAAVVSMAVTIPITARADMDRLSAMRQLERNCHNYVLSSGTLFQQLIMLGLSIDRFCDCSATLAVQSMTDYDMAVAKQQGHFPQKTITVFLAAAKVCVWQSLPN
jgi:hypothetical protein